MVKFTLRMIGVLTVSAVLMVACSSGEEVTVAQTATTAETPATPAPVDSAPAPPGGAQYRCGTCFEDQSMST